MSLVNKIPDESRTGLDSHVNMVVIESESRIIDWINRKICSTMPFNPSISCMKSVPFVHAALAYNCPNTHQTYVIIGRNIMYIMTLKDNVIVPFIMMEASIIVDDKPKIQCKNPDNHNHSLYVPDLDLRIPLRL